MDSRDLYVAEVTTRLVINPGSLLPMPIPVTIWREATTDPSFFQNGNQRPIPSQETWVPQDQQIIY